MTTTVTTVETVEVDGLTLGYREAGEGDPLLLLHGWPTSSFLYRDVMAPIARDRRAIALDLPGFGASSKPVDVRYSFDFFAAAIDGFLDALAIDTLAIAGHDLGGPIAVDWLLRQPGRVTHLVVLNTILYPDFDPTVLEFVRQLTTPGLREQATSDERLAEDLRLGVVAAPSADAVAGITSPFTCAEDRLALALAGVGLEPERFVQISERLTEIEVPVRVIYGEQDVLLPNVADTMQRLKQDIPQAEITTLPGAGHFLQEDAPSAVGEALAAFLAAHDHGV
jgi:haloalkane dehalogenase